MRIYNSETKKIEDFKPVNDKDVKMYTCGPTVYHYAHIGNLRSYIFEDVLEKALNYLGYKVNRVMNITDVGHLTSDADEGEDKLILGAKRENKSVLEIAKFYTEAFKKDFKELNLKWPDRVIQATSCIDVYIEMVSTLIDKGFAYISNGNVYFDVSKLKEYYILTEQKTDKLIIGARDSVNEDLDKKNPQDFVLWFTKSKFENQDLKWDSPWGIGYPGWHIECSGISYKYLGDYLDIHCGGVDNKFPHHTNEVAQSESFLGKKWCNYWFHVEHLNMANSKMSKSSGGFLTITSLKEKGYSPEVYKLFCLQSNYRKPLSFTFEGLESAKGAYTKLIKRLTTLKNDDSKLNEEGIKVFDEQFKSALINDLNTPLAITALFDLLKSDLNDNSKIELIKRFDTVLGLSLKDALNNEEETPITYDVDEQLINYINEKIELRNNAKKAKNYALADQIRNELSKKGISLIDEKDRTIFQIKQ